MRLICAVSGGYILSKIGKMLKVQIWSIFSDDLQLKHYRFTSLQKHSCSSMSSEMFNIFYLVCCFLPKSKFYVFHQLYSISDRCSIWNGLELNSIQRIALLIKWRRFPWQQAQPMTHWPLLKCFETFPLSLQWINNQTNLTFTWKLHTL